MLSKKKKDLKQPFFVSDLNEDWLMIHYMTKDKHKVQIQMFNLY